MDARNPAHDACCGDHGHDGHHDHDHDHDHCCGHDHAPAAAQPAPAGLAGQRFRIPTMDCPVEENEIRRALEPLAGIRALNFHLSSRTLAIDANEDALHHALAAIRKAGFTPEPVDAHADVHAASPGLRTGIVRLGAALGLAIAAEALHWFAGPAAPWPLVGMAIALAAIWLAGWEVYRKGIAALRNGRLNINALMAVAVTGAFVIGQWPEAAMVMALYAIAELIEALAVDRARNAIAGLLALAPEQALVQEADGWQLRSVREVALGAIVRIRPGERVPLDGIVTRGQSAVDQAPVTGESIPVDKGPGDPVFAGTVNASGELEFRVTATAGHTTLARIIHAVEQAQGSRAPTQRIVDRFAAVYTPAVFAIAVAVAVLLPLLAGTPWLAALYKALVLLVIACPCALVISTPVTVVSGLAAAARRGILVKGGAYLESARGLKAVAFDKTGTLTEGKPRLVHWQAWDGADAEAVRRLAASLAARSDHPVSQAIAAAIDGTRVGVENFRAVPGRGVEGRVAGEACVLANHAALHARGWCGPELEAALRVHEEQGRSVTLLAQEGRVVALFAVADTIRADARDAVAELQGLGIVPVLLSGDNAATARSVGAQAGIAEVRGELLPEDKLRAIQELQQRHGATAMVGDGINDAPALAQADIGFAMGGAGTDTAMEAADVVVMNDDLRRIAQTVRLSRRTHAILWQNITLALAIKGIFLLLAVFASATMWMAVFADMGAALLVVCNGLRMTGAAPTLRYTSAQGTLLPRMRTSGRTPSNGEAR